MPILNTIALLTSLSTTPPPVPPSIPSFIANPLIQYVRDRPRLLENQFREFFSHDQNIQLRVIHAATQEDAWRELHDTQNFAVIWISHAGGPNPDPILGGGLGDSRGFNVTPAFQQAHRNLRVLAVSGCGSSQSLLDTRFNDLLDRSRYPNLRIVTDTDFVSAETGLSRGLEQTRIALNEMPAPLPALPARMRSASSQEWNIRIRRHFDMSQSAEYVPALRIVNRRGAILAVFPGSSAAAPAGVLTADGQIEQSATALIESPMSIDDPLFNPRRLDLFVEAGANPHWSEFPFEMGEFTVEVTSGPENTSWQVFENPRTHRPVGQESRILRFMRTATQQHSN